MHPLDSFRFCPQCGSSRFDIHAFNAKKCADCGFEYYKNPSPGVGVLIFDNQDRLLCIRRGKNPGKGLLGLPGGFVDLNETIEEAAIREVWEETGIKIELKDFLGNIPNTYIYSGIEQYPLDFYFSATITDDSHIKMQVDEITDILFIPRTEIKIEAFAFHSARILLKKILG